MCVHESDLLHLEGKKYREFVEEESCWAVAAGGRCFCGVTVCAVANGGIVRANQCSENRGVALNVVAG